VGRWAGQTPDGETVDLISVFEGVGAYRANKIDAARLKTLEDFACPSCGSCSGLFTANSMNCLLEVLGLALPFNGSALALSPEREALIERAARQILHLVEANLTPRSSSPQAIDDAFALDMAMGGSTNTVLHTLAFAHEAGIDYPLSRINSIADHVPYLSKISPSGPWHMEDVHRAGGIPAMLNEIARWEDLLHLDRPSVCAASLKRIDCGISVQDQEVIRSIDHPHRPDGGLAILFGNLAPRRRGHQDRRCGSSHAPPQRPSPYLRKPGGRHAAAS
jgi:dihydroxy-acid dehydratase